MKTSVAIHIIAGVALVGSLFGCKKTLEEVNPSGTTAEAVYTTAIGYETLVNAAYSYNRSWYGKEDGMGLSEMGTDLWTAGEQSYNATSGLAGENRSLILYENLNPVNLNVTRLWKQLYAAVNLCNAGIKISEEGGDFIPNPKRVAELRFLRAFYYWHIVETWGGVHFTTEPTTTPVLTANRTPVSTFYDLIISDLTTAASVLDASSSEYGRVNQYVAKSFLARAYLSRAYISNNLADFSSARDLANEVITTGPYSLLANYEDLWNMNNQKNTEVIWSVNYAVDPNLSDVYNGTTNPYGYGVDILSANGNPTNNRGNNNLHSLFIPLYDKAHDSTGGTVAVKRDVRSGWPFDRYKPTKFLLDLFDGSKDARYSGSFQTVWKVNANHTGRLAGKTWYVDTALYVDKNAPASTNYYTFDVYDSYNPDGSSKNATSQNNQLFPTLIKFKDSTRSASPNDYGSGNIQSVKDVFVIRLAEMYLIAAEAELQLGNAPAAATQINVLRSRAALPGQLAAMQVTAGDVSTIDDILDERAREFAGEQIRWFDLKRTGKLVERVQAHNPDIAPYIQSNYRVRPIPQTQMDAVTNRGEFYQNPGY